VGRSAIVLVVPEVDEVVGRWRERDDPSAARGMPAHITLLYPFLDAAQLDDEIVTELEDYFRGVDGFDFVLRRVGRFPTTVFLLPEPSDVFSGLTRSLTYRWPQCQPYGGQFPNSVPHLSVSRTEDVDRREEAATDIAPRLPISAVASEATLWVEDDATQWHLHTRLPLGPP